VVACALLLAVCTPAQVAKRARNTLDDLATASGNLQVHASIVDGNALRQHISVADDPAMRQVYEGWDRFLTENGTKWRCEMDRRTGVPAVIEGQGIPWIPGRGNSLHSVDLRAEMGANGRVNKHVVVRLAKDFMRRYPELFGVDVADLKVAQGGTGEYGGYLWYVQFRRTFHGLPVENAYIVFRVNNGNLIQFGGEFLGTIDVDPIPTIDAETARQILAGYIGGLGRGDVWVNPGSLSILPTAPQGDSGIYVAAPGHGVDYKLVYTVAFRRPRVLGTWTAKIDAHTGEILAFRDANEYGSVTGGVYQNSNADPEVVRPMHFINVSNSGTKTADAGGNYTYSGGTASASLTGKYVKVSDSCGTSSLSTSTSPGDLAFSTSSGTDCTTPGVGGSGNTHAARTTYYHLTAWKEKALGWLPSNSWLKGQLTDKVNLNQTCNAYWDGSAVNFFKSGGGCSNTGELPTVFLHEVGHGLDSNDGSPSSTVGSSESYADINAVLTTHESCIGVNFIPGQQCSGYGNPCTNCTGIRDADYTKHSYSTTPAKPTQLSGSSGFHCSTSSSYPGPCGYEGHCESYIMSEVGWDLAAKDLPAEGYDQATSWMIADRLFFLSRSTSGDAYSCPNLSGANGCGTSNWFTTFRAVDDDDGNLSNGTPHAAAIYAAFNRHGIACTSVTNTSYSACPSIGQPALTATSGSGSVGLSWTSVSNASAYKVLRNEFSANAGMTIVATVSGTSYTDAAVAPGLTYYYSVQAVGSNDACFGPVASVKSVVPGGGTPPTTYSISGTVSGDVANGVTMTLAGAGTGTATTNSSGTYSFSGLANGTYTVTPSLSGYTFTPSSQSVTISGANRTGINFTATASGGSCSALTASYNSTYHCPAVTTAGKSVAAPSSLLQCVGSGKEANAPNTINGCADGTSGTCHSDESIEAITIATSDGTSCLAPGQQVTVTVSTYCYSTADYVTFFYSTNASSPSWTKVGSTQQAPGSGYKTFTWTFTLSGTAGTMQAVRAQMTYNKDPGTNACYSGNYNDRDDLAFMTATTAPPATYSISGTVSGDVANGVTMTLSGAGTGTTTTNSSGTYSFSGLANGTYTVTPSLSGYTFTPSSQSVTISGANRTGINFTSTASGGNCNALTASYNSTYHCPAVTTAGKSVTAPSSLLQCRGTTGESNAPNTINGCADGNSGSCHSDESIEAITIATSDGTSCLTPGQQVTVTVSAYCWGTADYVTFYYATNASSPSWTKVGSTQQAPGSGYKTFTWTFTLSGTAGTMQAVRAQMTYNADPGTNACYSGSYNDRDDLAFRTGTTALGLTANGDAVPAGIKRDRK
jgi:hypothetical protein